MGDRWATIEMGRKGGCCASFGGCWVPISYTMWPAPRSTSVSSVILIHPAVWPQYMGRKWGAALPPFLGRGAGSQSNIMSPGPRRTSVPSGILIHPLVWPQHTWAKIGGCAPFGGGGMGHHLTQCGWVRGLRPCQVSFWSIQPFGHNTPTLQTYRTDNSL